MQALLRGSLNNTANKRPWTNPSSNFSNKQTLAAYCWQHRAEVVAPLPRQGLLHLALAPAAAAGKQFGHVGLICNGGEDLDLVHQASEVPAFKDLFF